MNLLFLMIFSIIVLAVYSIIMLVFLIKSGRPLRTFLLFVFMGLALLAAVDLLSRFSGVYIPVSPLNTAVCSFFGAPGVIGTLLLNLILR